MLKKRKSLVIIPPNSKRIRYLRIRLSIFVFLGIIFLIGITGFFLPFNSLSLDVVEINQKRNLTDQNIKLLSKIRNMSKMLLTLKSRIDTLTHSQNDIEHLIGLKKKLASSALQNKLNNLDLNELINYTYVTESFYRKFAMKIKNNSDYISYVPVLKPVLDDHVISANFGKMKDPFTGIVKWHNGVDYSAKRGTSIIATASGVVDMVQKHDDWGKRIRIKHKFGFTSVYAHLGQVNVSQGKKVIKGDVIATIGVSGLTTGPHLHYEIHRHGTTVDPERYIFPEPVILASSNE